MPRFFYDLHIHSCLSPCGDVEMTPANIAGMAFVNGLQVIALTDHNTVKNGLALQQAAAEYGLSVLFGMELTTAEEVHVVCLFADWDAALQFDTFVYERLMKIKNNPDIFGHQLCMDSTDGVLGEEENLLINATGLAFEDVFAPVAALRGVAFPAHVDKQANSLLANLGFVPPESTFTLAEFKDLSHADAIIKQHAYFNKCRLLCNSDAHYLQDIHPARQTLEAASAAPQDIINALRQQI